MLVGGKTVMKDVTIWSQGRPVKESRKRARRGACWLDCMLCSCTLETRQMLAFACEAWSFPSRLLTSINSLKSEDRECSQECCQPGSLCTQSGLKRADPAAQLAAVCLVKMAALRPGCKCGGETGRSTQAFLSLSFHAVLHVNSFKGIHHFLLYMNKRNKE